MPTPKFVFISAFFLTIVFTVFTEPVQAQSEMPVLWGKIYWHNALKVFEGEVWYQLPPQSQDFQLVLYPNRYLNTSQSSDRESLEAYTQPQPFRERAFLRRRSSLYVSESEHQSYGHGPCTQDTFRTRPPLSKQIAPLVYNATETVVRYRHPKVSADTCEALKLRFSFSPPHAAGNFGISGQDEMHFAGPIYPFPRKLLFNSSLEFQNSNLFCADCTRERRRVVLRTQTFPSPLHIFQFAPSISHHQVMNQRLTILERGDSELAFAVTELLRAKILEIPAVASSRKNTTIFVTKDQLVQNIVGRQFNEIQLGAGFFKISPFFRPYHEAAFSRALVTELLFQKFVDEEQPRTTDELRELYALSRWLAEIEVRTRFRNIDTVKDISSQLSFIPFFNDILQGKALVNNDIFLGKEEGENASDTLPFNTVFPTFNGIELDERFAWCFSEDDRKKIHDDFQKAFDGLVTLRALRKSLRAPVSVRCGSRWKDFLKSRSLSEIVDVSAVRQGTLSTVVRFKREPNPSPVVQSFFLPDDDVPIDVLEFETKHRKDGNAKVERSKETNDIYVTQLNASDSRGTSQVNGPTTDGAASRHVYPREIKFLLTGIQVRYDTNSNQIEGRQGVEWRLEGDVYHRSFTLALRREKGSFYLDSSLGGRVVLDDPEATLASEEEPFLPQSRPTVPLGLGFRTKMGPAPELWLTGSVGYARLTSSLLAPEGYASDLAVAQSVFRNKSIVKGYRLDSSFVFYQPIATLTTLGSTFRVGTASDPVDIGAEFVPGAFETPVSSKQFASTHLQLDAVMAHDLKTSLLNAIVVEHVIFYGAHNFGVDWKDAGSNGGRFNTLQSLQTGVRFYGTFFGSKNQTMAIDLSRGLDKKPRNVISLSIGR